MNRPHLAEAVGLRVDFETSTGDGCHGTIAAATYSLFGEVVVIVEPDPRPTCPSAKTVLIGRRAAEALGHIDVPAA